MSRIIDCDFNVLPWWAFYLRTWVRTLFVSDFITFRKRRVKLWVQKVAGIWTSWMCAAVLT